MKMIFKRVLSVVLTVVILLTAVPFSSYATENEATVEQENSDVSVSATNSLGSMITETIDNENLGVDSDYVITDLTFEGNTATVSYIALENCNLVVAVYDENTMQMLTSEVLILFSDGVSATVTFIDALPEFFIAKAFLVDMDYAPLCKEYVSRKNTTEFVEFMETKSTDFEEDKVINLDNSEDNNFLVLGDDAQKIKGDTETNVLVSSDIENNTYMFENINSNISSLKKGDIFHLDNGDVENLVVIKVASISIDGTTATIVAEASSLEEVFEVIKLDSDELKTGVDVDSAESGTVSEDGEITTDAVEGDNEDNPWKETKTFSLEKELNNDSGDSVKITGTAVFTLEAHYEIYVSRKWSEISFIINPSAVVTVTVDGVISERRYKIGHFYFSMYGVTIGVEPEFVFSASANITLTGTWKTQIGFGFNTSDGFVNKSISPTFEPIVKITGQFYVGFNLAPYLTFVHEAVVDIKFTTEIGITIKATYLNDSGHECDNCIDGDILWSAKLDVDLAILWGLIDTSKNENYKDDIWKKEPTKFADFYYSFDHSEFGFGECPYSEVLSVYETGRWGNNILWTLYKNGLLVMEGRGDMYNLPDTNHWEEYSFFNDLRRKKEGKSVMVTEVIIGNGITSVGDSVFRGSVSVESVSIPDGVRSIGEYAFAACKIETIRLPKTLKYIYEAAFFYCEKLTQVTIPDGVINIGPYAFDTCLNLSSVIISDSVTTIGDGAFSECDSLTDVYYSGTQEQWKKISIGSYNDCLLNATIHYNSTGPTTDSVSEFIVDSVEEIVVETPVALENCFTFGGCVSGGSYTLVTVTENTEPLTLSNENVLYFDLVVANDCGMISTDFLPKTQVDGCVTLLIGDFGNGTEVRVVTTTTYTAGDINLDTSFDGMDAIVVACVVNGMLTEEQIGTKKFEIADANLDGVIDTLDVTHLENKGLYLS